MTLVTLVIVDAERPLLQLLDQLLLDVGGGATGEGVLGLAVVEGHLLDDIRVWENLWQNFCKTVDYTALKGIL